MQQNAFQHVHCAEPQTGGVGAGVASEQRIFDDIPVDQQAHMVFSIEKKPQNACGARRGVKELFHKDGAGKRKAGGANLAGKFFCAERLSAGHD